eukprot:scaffold322269_cov21-Tisochrysis_lutea.AAC.1
MTTLRAVKWNGGNLSLKRPRKSRYRHDTDCSTHRRAARLAAGLMIGVGKGLKECKRDSGGS